MVSHEEIFYYPQQERTDYPEHPNVQITVKIQLKKEVSPILSDLNKALALDNMEAFANNNRASTITVKGILPEDGYGAQDILEVVKKYDRRASIIS